MKPAGDAAIVAEVGVPGRALLFCVASATEWGEHRDSRARWIDRDGKRALTRRGRTALARRRPIDNFSLRCGFGFCREIFQDLASGDALNSADSGGALTNDDAHRLATTGLQKQLEGDARGVEISTTAAGELSAFQKRKPQRGPGLSGVRECGSCGGQGRLAPAHAKTIRLSVSCSDRPEISRLAKCLRIGGYHVLEARRPSSNLISCAASEPDIIRPIFAGGTDATNLALRG
jgi:hypothetical protein